MSVSPCPVARVGWIEAVANSSWTSSSFLSTPGLCCSPCTWLSQPELASPFAAGYFGRSISNAPHHFPCPHAFISSWYACWVHISEGQLLVPVIYPRGYMRTRMLISIAWANTFSDTRINEDIVVRLKWGQTEYKGRLISVDSYMNIQLSQTEEFIDGKNTGTLGEVLIRYDDN